MNENNLYNLMNQSVQEHKSLWRIVNDYREDAEGDDELAAFWERLATEKSDQVVELQRLIAARIGDTTDAASGDTEEAEDESGEEVAPTEDTA
jgi:hypothetical protein